jgi:glyoxylase-like metal-dependent hydrolase (beta-lactamase superfamily II)
LSATKPQERTPPAGAAAATTSDASAPELPLEFAPGVYCLTVGKGLLRANVYFIRAGVSWVLVDTGTEGCAPEILAAAEVLFGAGLAPAAVLLTHDHPDHAGSAAELARKWRCCVWAHPGEMPIIQGDIVTFRKYAHPLDRWLILPLLSLLSKKQIEAIVSRGSLKDVARALGVGDSGGPAGAGAGADAGAAHAGGGPGGGSAVPGLPDWEAVPTPGHTPGHGAFFRRQDRVLVTGDALVTLGLDSIWGLVVKKPRLSGPPWYVTWNRPMAKKAIATLAELEPLVVAGGHGQPLSGVDLSGELRKLAAAG